ncbi:hypothetical protein QE152_g10473 [Popillia japonica]|uniref:Uncharacterized protein n=1 Tax=Popillia japonica TaxID=7064 RepID=A0AAW1LUM6_POPJA
MNERNFVIRQTLKAPVSREKMYTTQHAGHQIFIVAGLGNWKCMAKKNESRYGSLQRTKYRRFCRTGKVYCKNNNRNKDRGEEPKRDGCCKVERESELQKN